MNGYKDWLESKIAEINNLIENSIKSECYDVVYTLVTKVEIYKECLAEFEKENERDKSVSFDDIKVGKKYNFMLKNDDFSEVITIIAKGCENKGRYVWYSFESSPNVSFKGYEGEYDAVEYFEEVD